MNAPSDWQQIKPGVFRTSARPVAVGDSAIAYLKSQLPASPLHRVRLCTHSSDLDTLHEMLIAMGRETYIRPHRHLTKTESFHMIEGEMDVVIFDDAGRIEHVIPMAPHGGGKKFYYRLSISAFHSLVVNTPTVVFQEITNGPFNKEETLYAPWSPAESDAAGARNFRDELHHQLAAPGNRPALAAGAR